MRGVLFEVYAWGTLDVTSDFVVLHRIFEAISEGRTYKAKWISSLNRFGNLLKCLLGVILPWKQFHILNPRVGTQLGDRQIRNGASPLSDPLSFVGGARTATVKFGLNHLATHMVEVNVEHLRQPRLFKTKRNSRVLIRAIRFPTFPSIVWAA